MQLVHCTIEGGVYRLSHSKADNLVQCNNIHNTKGVTDLDSSCKRLLMSGC